MLFAATCGKLRHVTFAGDTLKRLRKESGLTQEELGKKSRIDRSAIVNIEAGKSGLGPERAKRLAQVLGVKPTVFVDPATVDQEGRPLSLEERVAAIEDRQRSAFPSMLERLADLEDGLERLERQLPRRAKASR